MKKTRASESRPAASDDLLPGYDFDYRKARPNRFADRAVGEPVVVALDPDVSRVFTTPESVNAVLRALISTMPSGPKRRAARR